MQQPSARWCAVVARHRRYARTMPLVVSALARIFLAIQWGKLFQVLEGLGIRVMVDVPESVATYVNDPANSKDKKCPRLYYFSSKQFTVRS